MFAVGKSVVQVIFDLSDGVVSLVVVAVGGDGVAPGLIGANGRAPVEAWLQCWHSVQSRLAVRETPELWLLRPRLDRGDREADGGSLVVSH